MRVLYGIHGTGHGHAMRGLTLARQLPEHDFLFVANDDAAHVLEPEFRVCRLPNLGTVFRNYKVDVGATVARAVPLLLHRERYIGEALRLIDDFRPHVCMTDLEYFVPRAAERAHLPCLTLDHQHIITSCRHELPLNMRWDAFVQGITPRWLFRPTDANLIISFYAPPLLPRYATSTRIAPPILRERVLGLAPRDEGHVLVYQSNSTHKKLIDILRAGTTRTCYVYGYVREEGREGNIIFKRKSEEEFLQLLAGCAYVVQGGGHTLMGEALYLGKPILSLPIRAMVEQRFNALYLERLGYGMQADLPSLSPDILREFEARLPAFKAAIARGTFCGNDLVFGLVDRFIRTGKLDMGGN